MAEIKPNEPIKLSVQELMLLQYVRKHFVGKEWIVFGNTNAIMVTIDDKPHGSLEELHEMESLDEKIS